MAFISFEVEREYFHKQEGNKPYTQLYASTRFRQGAVEVTAGEVKWSS